MALPGGEVVAQEQEEGGQQTSINCSGYPGVCWVPGPEPNTAWDQYRENLRVGIRPAPPDDSFQEIHQRRKFDFRSRNELTFHVSGGDQFTRNFTLEAGRPLEDPFNLYLERDRHNPNGPVLNYVVGISAHDMVDYSAPTRFALTDSLLLKGVLNAINFTTSAEGKDEIIFRGDNYLGSHRIALGTGNITLVGREDTVFFSNAGIFDRVVRGESIRGASPGMGIVIMDGTEGNTFFEMKLGPSEAEALGAFIIRRTPQNRMVEYKYPYMRTPAVLSEEAWFHRLSMAKDSGLRLSERGVFNLLHSGSMDIGEGGVDGWEADQGRFNLMSPNGAIARFQGQIGELRRLGDFNLGDGQRPGNAVFLQPVSVRDMRLTGGDAPTGEEDTTSWFRSDLAVENLTLNDNGTNVTMIVLNGQSPQSVSGSILAAEPGEGTVVVNNVTDGPNAVVFDGNIGSPEAELSRLVMMNGSMTFGGGQIWVRDLPSSAASDLTLSEGGSLVILNTASMEVGLSGIYKIGGEAIRDQEISVLGGGRNTVTFRGAMGREEDPIPELNVGNGARSGSAVFLTDIFAERVRVQASDGGDSYVRFMKDANVGSLQISDRTSNGTTARVATLMFDGTETQIVAGNIVAENGGAVVVNNSFIGNTSVIFNGGLGLSVEQPLRELRLDRGEASFSRGVWTRSLFIGSAASARIGSASNVNVLNTGGVLDAGTGTVDGIESGEGLLRVLGGQGRTVTFGGAIGAKASLSDLRVGDSTSFGEIALSERVGDAMFNGTVTATNISVGYSGSHARFGANIASVRMVLESDTTSTFSGRVETTSLTLGSLSSGPVTIAIGGLLSKADQTVIRTARIDGTDGGTQGNVAIRLHSGVLNHGELLTLIDVADVADVAPLNQSLYRVDNNLLMRFGMNVDTNRNALTITASARSPAEVAAALRVPQGIAGSLVSANQVLGSLGNTQTRRDFHALVNSGEAAAKRLATQLAVQREALNATSTVPIESGLRVTGLGLSRLTLLNQNLPYAKRRDLSSGLSSGDSSSSAAVWVKPFADLLDQEGREGSPGYKASTLGMVVGWELSLSKRAALGALVAYTDTDVRSDNSRDTRSEIVNYLLGMYGRISQWEWYMVAGRGEYETRRSIALGSGITARGNFDSKHYGVGLLWSRPIELTRNSYLTPEAGVSVSHVIPEHYTETGAGSLNQRIEPEDVTQTESRVSLRWHRDGRVVSPYVRGGVSYDLAGDEASAVSRYVRGGAPFVVESTEVSQFGLDAEAGITVVAGENFSVDLQYDTKWKSGRLGHGITFEATIKF